MPSDLSLADFHETLQIVMGRDDTHLHRFLIHGKMHGITRDGGLWFSENPKQIQLSSLHLRIKERFVYEYDFHAFWQHQNWLENILPFIPTKVYPVCIGGARQAPPAWCNGPLAYLEQKQYYSIGHIGRRLLEIVEDEEACVGDYREEAATMLFWLQAETFDRSAVNGRLALFVFRALQIGEDLEEDLDLPEEKNVSIQKMLQAVREFNGYITANENYIVNYGDHYRNGETISTAFVESTVNEVISKRFVKKQQMRWTKEGAHHVLQIRIQVLNDDLQQTFCKWYPGMIETPIDTEGDRAA